METQEIDKDLEKTFVKIAQVENIDLKKLDPNLPQLQAYLTLLFSQ